MTQDAEPYIKAVIGRSPEDVRDFLKFSRCFSFSGADAKLLIGPLVYVLMRGELTLYVGMSSRGAKRPFDPAHHVLRHMKDGDKLLLWPVKDAQTAERMERQLITQLKPILNGRRVTPGAREALGLRPMRVHAG